MRTRRLAGALVALATASAAHAQSTTQIIDATGDGAGNALAGAGLIAMDGSGNVFISGIDSSNAFRITPGGVVTEIIDSSGDGAGNVLTDSNGIAVDASGNVYIAGDASDNAFMITDPGGANVVTEIIDASGDGSGNALGGTIGIAVDAAGNVYVTGDNTGNAFKITDPGGANVVTEIIDSSGDGAGNPLLTPQFIAVDDLSGNVYLTGAGSNNAFGITPGGTVFEIIDASGDGSGNTLSEPIGIAVDALGDVYVTGLGSENAFQITDPGGANAITEIIDASGDGSGNTLSEPIGIAVDASGDAYVTGLGSDNAFRIEDPGGANTITEIIDASGDGLGNGLAGGAGIGVDGSDVWVGGLLSNNAFKVGERVTLGSVYCSPNIANSTGVSGQISVTGSDVDADDDLTLTATQLPTNANIGYFIMGTGSNVFVPMGAGSNLCVAPGIQRFIPPVNNTNQFPGGFDRVVGTQGSGHPVSANITPGSTWNFQAWHRDQDAGTSHFTDHRQRHVPVGARVPSARGRAGRRPGRPSRPPSASAARRR